MQKINLVVADSDAQYLDLFISYLRNSDYAGKFSVKSFSSKDKLGQFLNDNELCDILLTIPEFADDIQSIESTCIMLLQEDWPTSAADRYTGVYKYQPLNQLLSQVVSTYSEKEERAYQHLGGNRKTRILSVYSAQGGTGKSTFAVNLASQLASQSLKVFYLNLEHLNFTPFHTLDSNNFSKILYYLKANPQQIKAQFESLRKHDPYTRVDYFEPLQVSREILDMSSEEASLLVEIIAERAFYDVLIIDLESSVHERIIGSLQMSDVIFWMVIDDVQCLNKTRMLLYEFKQSQKDSLAQLLPRIRFIQNKRLNSNLNNLEDYGLNINGYLPYVPEWKAISNVEQIYGSLFFKQEAGKIYARL